MRANALLDLLEKGNLRDYFIMKGLCIATDPGRALLAVPAQFFFFVVLEPLVFRALVPAGLKASQGKTQNN